jgi:hypothetical protein
VIHVKFSGNSREIVLCTTRPLNILEDDTVTYFELISFQILQLLITTFSEKSYILYESVSVRGSDDYYLQAKIFLFLVQHSRYKLCILKALRH